MTFMFALIKTMNELPTLAVNWGGIGEARPTQAALIAAAPCSGVAVDDPQAEGDPKDEGPAKSEFSDTVTRRLTRGLWRAI